MKELIDSFEKDRGFVTFQIESFNRFIREGIQKIIQEIKEIKLSPEIGDVKLIFGKVYVERPFVKEADGSTRRIFPNEARTRNLNYSAPVFIDIVNQEGTEGPLYLSSGDGHLERLCTPLPLHGQRHRGARRSKQGS